MDAVERDIRRCLREFIGKHNLLAMRVSHLQDFGLSEHADYWAIREEWIEQFKDIVSILVTLETPGLTTLYAKSLSLATTSNPRKLTFNIDSSHAKDRRPPNDLTKRINEEFWSDVIKSPDDGIFFIENIIEKLKGIYQIGHGDFEKTIEDHGVLCEQYGIRFVIAGLPSIDPYSSTGYFGRSFWVTAIESTTNTNHLSEEAALEWLFDPDTSYKQDDLPFFIKNPDDLYRSCSAMVGGKFLPDTPSHNATDGNGNLSLYWKEHHSDLNESLSGISKALERLLSSSIFTEASRRYEPLKKVCCAKSFITGEGLWLPFLTEIFQPRNFRGGTGTVELFWRIKTNVPGHILLNLKSLHEVLQQERTSPKLYRCSFEMSPKNARLSILFTECTDATNLAREIATIETSSSKGNLRVVLKNLHTNGVEVTSCSLRDTLTVNLSFKLEQIT